MAHPGERTLGDGAHAAPGALAETSPDSPDDAVGPEDRTLPELAELSNSPEGRRIEQKLRAEALARRGGEDEDAAIDDTTGHA